MQAEIAACHARAASVEDTDWERIAALYVVLAHLTPSPVVELNRAVAVGMAYGPDAAWTSPTGWLASRRWPATSSCPPSAATCWPGSAGSSEARAEFTRAAALTSNERERALFLARAAECEEPEE